MKKLKVNVSTYFFPLPIAMVSCGANETEHNIITISWTGIINSDPPMTYISVRPGRHSHDIIKNNKEFVINFPNEKLLKEADYCGIKSGDKNNKFEHLKLTPEKSQIVKAPQILECPISLECKVKDVKSLGSHDMFIAEIVAVNADEKIIDTKSNKLLADKGKFIAYMQGEYCSIGKKIEKAGFSIK